MLEKLKKVINREFISKIDKQVLKQHSFLPVSEQNGVLFVACVGQDSATDLLLKDHFNCQVKYIVLPQEQFDELYDFAFPQSTISKNTSGNSKQNDKNKHQKKIR